MIRDPFKTRLLNFRKLLDERALDAFLVAVPENRYYLSGYGAEDLQLTESSGYLLITSSDQYLLTDFRYQEEAKSEAPAFELVLYTSGLNDVLSDLFSNYPIERLGIEGHYLTHDRYQEVLETLQSVHPKATAISAEGLVEQLRIVKEPEEIELIKASLALTERALLGVWENLSPGRPEKQVAWEIERRIREGGAEAVSFQPIAATGPNGALPHAVPTDRCIEPGDALILDLGSKLDHYCSDMTRTWIAGTPPQRLQEIYQVVRDAQLAAQDAIRAGKDSVEIDSVARNLIAKAGYADYFGHGLGHGVGLAVHEKPGLRKKNPVSLEENMIVTVEPGIYLPGFGGVRLENMVLVKEGGCEILNEVDLFYRW